jgi:hypothetical protein
MVLDNGQKYDGDLLVGADGIWSMVLLIFSFIYSLIPNSPAFIS